MTERTASPAARWILGAGALAACAACTPGSPPSIALAPDTARASPPTATCPADPAEAASKSALRATLRVREPRVASIQAVAVEVSLSNPGPAPVRWLGTYAGSGSLALEVRDAACQPVHGGPPPTPQVDDGVTGWSALAPGASVPLSYQGWILVDVPPGRYEVRFRGVPGDTANAEVRSEWAAFEVTGSK
jgi:hypothetical protein